MTAPSPETVPWCGVSPPLMTLTIVAFGFLVFTWVGVEALRLPTAHGSVTATGAGRVASP